MEFDTHGVTFNAQRSMVRPADRNRQATPSSWRRSQHTISYHELVESWHSLNWLYLAITMISVKTTMAVSRLIPTMTSKVVSMAGELILWRQQLSLFLCAQRNETATKQFQNSFGTVLFFHFVVADSFKTNNLLRPSTSIRDFTRNVKTYASIVSDCHLQMTFEWISRSLKVIISAVTNIVNVHYMITRLFVPLTIRTTDFSYHV